MTDDSLLGRPVDLPRLALSLARLSLVGFSLVLLGQMLWLTKDLRADFVAHNALGVHPRQVLLLAIAGGLALPTVVTLFVAWLRRRRAEMLEALHRAAALSAPLAVAFLIPGLFLSSVAEQKPLFYLTILIAFGLAFQPLLSGALDVAPTFRRPAIFRRFAQTAIARAIPFALLLVAAVLFVLVLGHYAALHHRLIQNVSSDIGVVDNVMANLLRGHGFRAPTQFGTEAGSYLSLHAEYGSWLFLPIYWLHPGAETLLWLQVSVAALGAIPLYLLVVRRLGRRMALWFGVAYLLSAPLHGALLVGFTWFPAVTTLSFCLYYAVESERRWMLGLSLVALLSISEAGPLNVLAFALFMIVSGKRARLGITLVALSSALVAFNAVRSVRGVGAMEHPPLTGAITALLENPSYFLLDLTRAVKLTPVMHALAPLCLLPLFELVSWPLFLPPLLYVSAAGEFWPAAHAGYGQASIWIPACFLALLVTLERQRVDPARQHRYRAWVVALTITQLSHSFDFGALLRADGFGGDSLPATYRMTPAGQARYDQLMQLVRRIPVAASVATTEYLVSHVSNHAEAYVLSRPYGKPDYILLSSREVGGVRPSLAATFATHQYRLVSSGFDEFYLFTRGAETAATTQALAKLGITTP